MLKKGISPFMNRFEAVLFDLGDTLIYFDDNWPDVFSEARQALLESLQQSGLDLGQDFIDEFYTRMQAYYRERDTEFIEYTTQYVLRAALTARGLPDVPDEVLRRALYEFHKVTQSHWIPEEDALPTLDRLRAMGYRMAAISNAADDDNTQVLIDKAGVRPYFEVILSSAAQGIRKPNPKIFRTALQMMDLPAVRAVMVGDTLGADILGAHNAGIFAVWVTRRAGTPANRAHADTIRPDAQIYALGELPDLLERLENEVVLR
jgi:HAD superfamily hydrolase (TIGR01509 family)